ncbi:TonB-dependent receptor [uncultured Pontibacter sp.]|uniref:TonB-dependent receptor n=1 Tax=uncultured Pontibacter sp. TaxID=453356 RepID=UPI00262D9E31|nr:TonB-dependent receptor [uncultured Pontibacter sp.]
MAHRILLLLFLLPLQSFAQTATVKGTITSGSGAVTYATVMLKDTKWGASANEAGQFEISGIAAGSYQMYVSAIGYRPYTVHLALESGKTETVSIQLTEVDATLNEVVVTGTRTSRRRLESPVAVNVLDSRTFNLTQSNTLSEGLCFQPGLRMETDCQTCNYTQLRMNGLGGSYSQLLVNSRPVFTSLMSLYGLEQIPANMIERVEIVRGGGSVLYGSSAIAGTVNIITKEPQESAYTLSANSAVTGGQAWDQVLNANVNAVNEDKNAGISFFGSHRDREAYDANQDGFSELPRLKNNSFGFNAYFKPTAQNKLEINGWSIHELRHGGDKLDKPADQADQSEYRIHDIILGGFNYEHHAKNGKTYYSIYGAAQNTKRVHYTGIDQADGWGNTKNHTLQGGLQFNFTSHNFLGGSNTFTTGAEHMYDYTFDQIEAYNFLVDQKTNLSGFFLQSDWDVSPAITILSGIRANKHTHVNRLVFTPRLSGVYKLGSTTQFRASFARGFKAPQAFETDLHIAFAGGGISLIQVDSNLKEETSGSVNASVDFNKPSEHMIFGFTLDAFYTRLHDAFVLEETGTDENGNQQLLRKNGGNSTVKGITMEGRINYDQVFQLESGITLQRSRYDNPVAWSSSFPGTRTYLRTPDTYGYYVVTLLPQHRFTTAISGVITGPMLVPHFGGAPGVPEDVLHTSPVFVENNLKLAYRFTIKSINQDLQLSAGVQNMFNQYQKDFDIGKNRDSNYVYGPARPRTFYVGLKFRLM